MSLTKDQVLAALRAVRDPESGEDLVSLNAVRRCAVCDGHVGVTVALPSSGAKARESAKRAIIEAVDAMAEQLAAGKHTTDVEFVVSAAPPKQEAPPGAQQQAQSPQANAKPLPGVARIIAVGAGKGGVGKSSVSLNLAVGLARKGHAVGIMDGDIYGPSMPTLLGLTAMEPTVVGKMLQPFHVHGVKATTIGKLVDPERPLIWRGPMAHGAFKQLAEQTQWGELDYLIIDLPPGTGDVPLTMAQMLALDGAVIVCTPQKVAQDDAVRAARMFQSLGIEVIGVVENMSYFIGDDGREYDIFGRGGAEKMAQRLGLPFLGQLPIHMELRANSDAGNPTANFEGNEALRAELERLVDAFEKQVTVTSMRKQERTPTLTVR
ncbi:MAG: Mrp/NBP35 family ATP-binding protein [Phycisphaerales bacterium]